MKKNFTLIELLVVIAIIAILASMLMPALSKARAKARTISCVSNMKNLALGFLMYADDNNDALPDCQPKGNNYNPGTNASDLICEYVAVPDNGRHYHYPSYTFVSNIFRCPCTTSTNYNGNYGWNYWFVGDRWNNPGHQPNCPPNIASLKKPTDVYVMADAFGETTLRGHAMGANPMTPANQGSNLVGFRHDQRANASFADGHVETVRQLLANWGEGTYCQPK